MAEDKRRIVVNRQAAVDRGDVASVDSKNAAIAKNAANIYDRFVAGQLDDDEAIPAPWEAIEGATTGAARQLFSATQRKWDDSIPYPQIVPSNTSNEQRPRTVALGYDPGNQIVRITFREGAVYEYYGVPPQVYAELAASDSPGRFINEAGLDVYYDYRRRYSLE